MNKKIEESTVKDVDNNSTHKLTHIPIRVDKDTFIAAYGEDKYNEWVKEGRIANKEIEESYYQAAERNFREKNPDINEFLEIHYAEAFVDGCKYLVLRKQLGIDTWQGTIEDTFNHEWNIRHNSELERIKKEYQNKLDEMEKHYKSLRKENT